MSHQQVKCSFFFGVGLQHLHQLKMLLLSYFENQSIPESNKMAFQELKEKGIVGNMEKYTAADQKEARQDQMKSYTRLIHYTVRQT